MELKALAPGYYQRDKVIFRKDSEGARPRPVVQVTQPVDSLGVSPDGKTLALANGREVYTWRPEQGAQASHVLQLPERPEQLAFQPDGSLTVAAGGQQYHFDGTRLTVFEKVAGPVHSEKRWALSALVGAGSGLAAGVVAYLTGLPPAVAGGLTALAVGGIALKATEQRFPEITRAERSALVQDDPIAGTPQTYPFGSVRQDGQRLEVEFASGWRLVADGIGDKPDILSLPESQCYGEQGRALGQRNAAIPRTFARLYGPDGFPRDAFRGDARKLKILYDGAGALTVGGVKYDLKDGTVSSDWLRLRGGQIEKLVVGSPENPVSYQGNGTFSSSNRQVSLALVPEVLGELKMPAANPPGGLVEKRIPVTQKDGLLDEVVLIQKVRRPPTAAGEWLEQAVEEVVSERVEARFTNGATLKQEGEQVLFNGQPVPGQLKLADGALVISLAPGLKGDVVHQAFHPGGVDVVRLAYGGQDHHRQMGQQICDLYHFDADGKVEGGHRYPAKGGGFGEYPHNDCTVDGQNTLKTGMLLGYYQYSQSDIQLPVNPSQVMAPDTAEMSGLLGPELRQFTQDLLGRRPPETPLADLAQQMKFYASALPEKPEMALKLVDLALSKGPELVQRYLQDLIVAADPAARLEELLADGTSRVGIAELGERVIVGGTVVPTRRNG